MDLCVCVVLWYSSNKLDANFWTTVLNVLPKLYPITNSNILIKSQVV